MVEAAGGAPAVKTRIPFGARERTPGVFANEIRTVGAAHSMVTCSFAINSKTARGSTLRRQMWVAPAARGLGLGRRLLRELEAFAAGAGATAVRLETNRALTEAIALYKSGGYTEVPAFNDERYADHWFEKRLPPMAGTQRQASA